MSSEPLQNLSAMLHRQAQLRPSQTAVVFDDVPTTYSEIWDNASRFARKLQVLGVNAGDRVILQLPNSAEFFRAFYGTLTLGAIAVPVFHGSSAHRLATLINLSGATVVVVDGPDLAELRLALEPHLEGPLPVIIDLRDELPSDPFTDATEPQSDDLAMLQYTSGTTGNPKGVMLTHRNLLANVQQMIPAARFTVDDVFVSWLPVYHDMGLITMTLCPFYLGAQLVLLPVSPKPFPWFSAIEKYGGTMTASPDFGYRFATKFTRRAKFDLSSLKRALIAAEPVRESTILRFEEKFNVPGVLKPGYGLAEASVAVSFFSMDQSERVIDHEGHVSAGQPIPGVDVLIDADGSRAQAGQQGEILIRGDNCTQGYYRNEAATNAIKADGGYLRTGDLGYIDQNGELFIVGRKKSLIIRAGRNLAPREIEETAEELPGVRLAAAMGLDAGGIEGEQIVLFCEVERGRSKPEELESLTRDLQQAVYKELGYRPDKVVLVKPQTIPRTYNGKLQYIALKRAFSEGAFERDGLVLSRAP